MDIEFTDSEKVLRSFLNEYEDEGTRRNYRRDVERFYRWCDSHSVHPMAVTTEQLQLHIDKMLGEDGLAPKTVARAHSALSGLFTHAVKKLDLGIESNPMNDVPRPADEVVTETVPLTVQELRALLDAAAESRSGWHLPAIMLVGVVGLRPYEVSRANVEDLRPDGDYYSLAVQRGSVEARLVLPPRVSDALLEHIDDRTRGPLITNNAGNRMTINGLRRAIERACRQAKVPRQTSQDLWTTMGVIALNSGAHVEAVKVAVGVDDLTRFNALTGFQPSRPEEHASFAVVRALSRPGETPRDLMNLVTGMLHEEDIHPAAPIVLAGALLEAHLRELCDARGLAVKDGSISKYNQALKADNLYRQHQWRQLDAWNDLRNEAAHGRRLDELTMDQARTLAEGVSKFMQEYPVGP